MRQSHNINLPYRLITLISLFWLSLLTPLCVQANPIVEGREFLLFNSITALNLPGDKAPEYQSSCERQLSWLLHHHPVETTYRINTANGIQSAHTYFLGEDIMLYPMGLAGKYKFISDGVGEKLKALRLLRIVYGTNYNFTQGSLVLYFMGENGEHQCALDSLLER